MNVTCYRAGERRYLAVDADEYVPDRAAFAVEHCDPEDGLAPDRGQRAGDRGQRASDRVQPASDRGEPATDKSATGGADGGSGADGAGAAGSSTGADGVLFLALEPAYRPVRVVMTVVTADGEQLPACVAGVRCAARWVADRTGADRAMVDTQAGTFGARVLDDGSVAVEVTPESTAACSGTEGEPAESDADGCESVVAEFTAELQESAT